jgi:DNA-binding SARP family transcriptional activator/tetratricopeptide (TPR) repeat protein
MLGPFEASHEDVPVQLGDQQQRFVLIVLLLHANRPVSAARLTEIVWPDNPERRSLVRSYIKRLREVFQEADADDVHIETTPTGYVLRIDENQLDTVRFDRLRMAAEAVRVEDPRRAVELLRTAVGLWHGKFLEDIDIDRVGGADVIPPDNGRIDAIGDLAELELEIGDHRSARDRLRRVMRSDPVAQRPAELLMRALLAGGDRVAAIRVFHDVRDALVDIDFEPGLVLRNLAARAEHGEPPCSLPSRPGAFVGRDAELAEIAAATLTELTDGECRAVWVSGAPGVGKTGLAIEAAHRLRGRFPDGQLLVRLNGFTPNASPTTVADALTQLLVELGVPVEQIPATVGRKATLYQTTLYGTRTLVVLDNAAAPEQIRPLLPEEPDCLAIVTSRRTGDPDIGKHIRLAPLAAEQAAELFRALNDPIRVRGGGGYVAAVVRRCGFLPMPIQVVAALFRRHERWPLDHLLRLLEDSALWGADTGDADGTAGTAAVRVSYQLLGEPQQAMFRLLGGLPGPDVDVTAAAALADRDVATARVLLDDLHEVSLLEEVAPERYEMLDPLKEFAAANESATEHADAVRRLLDYYLVTLATAVGVAYPFDRPLQPVVHRASPVALAFTAENTALAWIAVERANLVAAIHYAATHDLPEHVWRLAVLMWRYFNTKNRLAEWIRTMELARRIVAADPSNDYGQAHVLLRLAIGHDRCGELAQALELAAAARSKWSGLGDVYGEAAALCAIAVPTMELGDHDRAIEYFAEALPKYEQSGDVRGQAHVLSMLGYLNELHRNLDDALRQQHDAARMLREIGHRYGAAHVLNNLGSVQQRLGLLDDALSNHTEAHGHAVAIGDHCAQAYSLNHVGNVYRARGRFVEAMRYHDRAKAIAADMSDSDLSTQLHLDRGATARAAGDHAEALRAARTALDLATSSGNRSYQARAHRGIAATLHAMDDHDGAVAHWTAAETGFGQLGLPEGDEVRAERAALECACHPAALAQVTPGAGAGSARDRSP